MFLFLSVGLPVLAAAVILVPVYMTLNRCVFQDFRKSLLYCLFSLYLAAVYTLVGMPDITYIRFEINLNLIPFLGFFDGLRSSLLNVVLFVPLGLALPVLWEKYRKGKATAIFGFGMSLTIELLQMFTFRATDINDLMTNTFGTLLGWLLGRWLVKKFPAVNRLGNQGTGDVRVVFSIAFGTMFFVQPFLFSFLWDVIMH